MYFKQQFEEKQVQNQQQKFILNASMKQSLDILKMPLADLRTVLYEEIETNPMLEIDNGAQTSSPFDSISIHPQEYKVYDENNMPSIAGKQDFDPDKIAYSHGQTCSEMLLEELSGLRLDNKMIEICTYLVECLDSRGYLKFSPEELAEELDIPHFDIMQAIYVIQTLSPSGVGAADLEECLLIQLVKTKHFNAHTVKIIKHGLGMLAENDVKGLCGLIQCSKNETLKYINVVRGLNPIPASGYDTGETSIHIIPDASIEICQGEVQITMNRSALPKITLSEFYSDMINTSDDKDAIKWLGEKKQSANSLKKAVDARLSTLEKIILCVVRLQTDFFAKGTSLVPMTLSDVAKELNLNVSTVSRAVNDKYVVSGAGTILLKSLFGQSTSKQNVSSMVLCSMIKQCIDNEDKSMPLSDEQISKKLGELEINVSRRTVTKYREIMGVKNTFGRKGYSELT